MFCSKCGKEMNDDATFCSGCGASLHNIVKEKSNAKGIVSLVLGIIGVFAWIIPIIGLPIGVIALIFGILGIKNSKGMSIAGIVLSAICIVLTIINASIGAYQGYHGVAWFQQGQEDTTKGEESTLYEEQKNEDECVITFRDDDGNVLMTGGIKPYESHYEVVTNSTTGGKEYVITFYFTDEASKQFAKITEEHIGEVIGIYMNEEMIYSPRVMSVITGGSCQITGVKTIEECRELIDKLDKCK